MISFHEVSEGKVYRVYWPAGTLVPPTVKSASVVKLVASLAPVRHTCPYGTTSPMILRGCPVLGSRILGRLYSMEIFLPSAKVSAAVPGGLGRLLLSCGGRWAASGSSAARQRKIIKKD